MHVTLKTAVVTGGASGIGRSICTRLARDGAQVAVLDLDEAGALRVAQAIGASGAQAIAVGADVADAASVAAAIDQVHRTLGRVHILVNDAGICEFVSLMEMSEEQWARMIAVHLNGTFHCTRAVVPDMVAAGWGRIVNLASVAGLNGGGPGLVHYAAAKGGIVGFSKALAHELGPAGITVNAIAPGLIDTPMVRTSGVPDAIIQATILRAPVRRIGTPDDIAATCAYLVSDEAGFFTGQVMSPNGGTYQ